MDLAKILGNQEYLETQTTFLHKKMLEQKH